MSIKTYASKYRNHKIVALAGEMGGGPKGKVIEFVHGFYTTDNLSEQQVIEGDKTWKRAITLVKEDLTPAELKAKKEAEAQAAAAAKAAEPAPAKPASPVGKGKK